MDAFIVQILHLCSFLQLRLCTLPFPFSRPVPPPGDPGAQTLADREPLSPSTHPPPPPASSTGQSPRGVNGGKISLVSLLDGVSHSGREGFRCAMIQMKVLPIFGQSQQRRRPWVSFLLLEGVAVVYRHLALSLVLSPGESLDLGLDRQRRHL